MSVTTENISHANAMGISGRRFVTAIKAHPLCEMCYKEGRTVFADVVHHTKPIAEGGASDESNLMSVCFHHHELIHRRRGDR